MLTPYAAHTLVNQVLRSEGLPEIKSQMMYNYTTQKINAGKKPLIKYDDLNGVDREDLIRWVKQYIETKKNGKVVHAPLDIS